MILNYVRMECPKNVFNLRTNELKLNFYMRNKYIRRRRGGETRFSRRGKSCPDLKYTPYSKKYFFINAAGLYVCVFIPYDFYMFLYCCCCCCVGMKQEMSCLALNNARYTRNPIIINIIGTIIIKQSNNNENNATTTPTNKLHY